MTKPGTFPSEQSVESRKAWSDDAPPALIQCVPESTDSATSVLCDNDSSRICYQAKSASVIDHPHKVPHLEATTHKTMLQTAMSSQQKLLPQDNEQNMRKVPIPRLNRKNGTPVSNYIIIPQNSNSKYKPIQPKPFNTSPKKYSNDNQIKLADILKDDKSYPMKRRAMSGPGGVSSHSKEKKNINSCSQDSALSFMLNSPTEHMEPYELSELMNSNSQDHEEELAQYFNKDGSDLRQGLHVLSEASRVLEKQLGTEQSQEKSELDINSNNSLFQKRRVSFQNSSENPIVPQSPNTRRRAFNFQPICSPGTPDIAVSPLTAGNVQCSSPSITSGIRSRNSSGQSYFTARTTPYSSMSETSNTPFMSPLGTPVSFNRSRHSSTQGPRPPLIHSAGKGGIFKRYRNFSGGAANNNIANSSNLVMPLESDPMFASPDPNIKVRSRHSSSGSKSRSPISNPLSPNGQLSDNNTSMLQALLKDGKNSTLDTRRRHTSAFTDGNAYLQQAENECQGMDQSSPMIGGNRCHSVPLFQMLQTAHPQATNTQSHPVTPLYNHQSFNFPVKEEINSPYQTPSQSLHSTPNPSVHATPIHTPVPSALTEEPNFIEFNNVPDTSSDLGFPLDSGNADQPGATSLQRTMSSPSTTVTQLPGYEGGPNVTLYSHSHPNTPLPIPVAETPMTINVDPLCMDGKSVVKSNYSASYPSTPVNVTLNSEKFLHSGSREPTLNSVNFKPLNPESFTRRSIETIPEQSPPASGMELDETYEDLRHCDTDFNTFVQALDTGDDQHDLLS